MIVKHGYKAELDLNHEQITLARKHCGAARFAYNSLRHEVACVAVGTEESGLNLVFYHQYPTETCVGSNPGVGQLSGQCTSSRKGAAEPRGNAATVSTNAVGGLGSMVWLTHVNR